jgi:hypothetical protein
MGGINKLWLAGMALVGVFGGWSTMGHAGDDAKDLAARYVLATAKAFRTTYVESVLANAKKAGVKPAEEWLNAPDSLMLPAQIVKASGFKIREFQLGLVGMEPISLANLPRTDAEKEALAKLEREPELQVITFRDGNEFKGISADFAIDQSCADCHNKHPNSSKVNFKLNDLMGALIVRIAD